MNLKAFVPHPQDYDNITAFLERHRHGHHCRAAEGFLSDSLSGRACHAVTTANFFGTTKPWSWTLSGQPFHAGRTA